MIGSECSAWFGGLGFQINNEKIEPAESNSQMQNRIKCLRFLALLPNPRTPLTTLRSIGCSSGISNQLNSAVCCCFLQPSCNRLCS